MKIYAFCWFSNDLHMGDILMHNSHAVLTALINHKQSYSLLLIKIEIPIKN